MRGRIDTSKHLSSNVDKTRFVGKLTAIISRILDDFAYGNGTHCRMPETMPLHEILRCVCI